MDPATVGIIGLCLFFLFLVLKIPIGLSFALAGFIGYAMVRDVGAALAITASMPYRWGSTYMLVVLPLFILMGQLTFRSGISRDLFISAHKWIGGQPGGLALATNLACTAFAACTGSSLASAATMSSIALPEMKKYNYDGGLATGCVAAGGTLGILIPPSTIMIVYGIMTETSIGKLFIAGILPGIMLSILFLVQIYAMCRLNPQLGPRGPSFKWRDRLVSLKGIWGVIALFLMVVGGIYSGMVTPIEAAGVGAFGALIITIISRRFTLDLLVNALKDTIQTTGMIFLILIGAQIFSAFLAIGGTPRMISEGITALNISPLAVLILILVIYIPLGMVMDSFPMILLTLPTFFPVVRDLGFDPIWFGILVTVMCELANITPPVGLNLYIVQAAVPEVPLSRILWGIVPFCITMMVTEAILVVFPQISLFLPSLMK